MGNTSTSLSKESPARKQSRFVGHYLALRDRFEELAVSATNDAGETQRFVLFDNCAKLAGPRGAQVAARLYRVLDADGDGRLDFREFSSAACLLKGSPDEDKLKILFKMYADAHKPGLVGREGLQAFILDMIAASPPPSLPPDYRRPGADGLPKGTAGSSPAQERGGGKQKGAEHERPGGGSLVDPDFEVALRDVLDKMAGVVLSEYDGDGDGMLSEKEWRSYVKREDGGVALFLDTLSDRVGKLLL